jgi:hypothetical protein
MSFQTINPATGETLRTFPMASKGDPAKRADLRRATGRLRRACIEHMRRNNLRRIEATQEAEEAWRDHVAELVDATLFPRAQSWYMGANIPKKREMLVYPGGLPLYLQKCKESADAGYAGFVLS